jgi:membrane-bound lytic murein transglycosylase B
MARHRLMPLAKQPAPVCRSYTALVVWPLHRLGLAAACQRAIRAARTPALSVAVATPVVLAGAAGAAAPQIHAPTPALRGTAISPVAAVRAAGSGPPGPAVATVVHPPTSFHIAAAAVSAPPPSVLVNSPGALGIPMIALSAYRNAEQRMAIEAPGCGVSWNLLAGIGRIESGHAGGGAVDARGTAVIPIYGPSLDGTLSGNEVILQSSVVGNRVTYARAMGPMQFLPGMWARYASDGKGDGTTDPQNLFDATLAAARYLCSGGLSLRDPTQVMAAILRYNNSMPYAQNVLGWAAAYATGVVPVDLPLIVGPPPPPLGDAHDEHPKGLGPGLPTNINGLPVDDPLARMPLIDFGPSGAATQQPMWPAQLPTPGGPSCTLICIGGQDPSPPQQPPWATLPPPDAPPPPPRQTVPPEPSTSSPSAVVSSAGPSASPGANIPASSGPMPGTAG